MITLPSAEQDIVDNTDYIYYNKQAPEAALRLLAGFRQTVESLDWMPEIHELDEDEDLASWGIHKCYYKNYKIFFYIDKEDKKVYILRVLHMLVNAKPLLLNYRF